MSARRRMENIASVSRSSGLEKDGDALKNFKTQHEYRQFIQQKVDDFWTQFPPGKQTNSFGTQRRTELQENMLILFRKLREGLVSSQRYDEFALEVYETSFCFAVLFQNVKQSSSILPHLLPEVYQKTTGPHPKLTSIILIALVHELLVANNNYQNLLNIVVHNSWLSKSSPEYEWISSLSSSLRLRNYHKFEQLTRPESFIPFLQPFKLAESAMGSLIDQIRSRYRDRTWSILRTAYRELACNEDSPTRGWLLRSLALPPNDSVDRWLEEKSGLGHTQRKEGVQDRWILARVR